MRQDLRDARVALGRQLSNLRKDAGLTQEQLAIATFVARGSVANIETGRQNTHRDFWKRADAITTANGALLAAYDQLRQSNHGLSLPGAAPAAETALGTEAPSGQGLAVQSVRGALPSQVNVLRGDTSLVAPAAYGAPVRQVLSLPGGSYFAGTNIEAEIYPAVVDRTIMAQVPEDYAVAAFLARSRRGLVVGATSTDAGAALYAVDSRHARRRLRDAGKGSRLGIPTAYRLDEVTLGLLWAVGNLDDALLDDDRLIAEQRETLEQYSGLTRSSAGLAAVAELSAVSALWLGSDFCARHILRHLDALDTPPIFWTREQRGEEASAWLFFAHKFDYLERLARRFASTDMTRTFCVPEHAVAESQPGERALIFLAMALMESFGIQTQLVTAPEYQGLDGFALDGQRRAVVANWVGCDGIWLVDVTEHRPTVNTYADAASYVAAHGLTRSTRPAERLQLLADYLGLDWTHMTRRCAELAACGLTGLIDPRSRLLSIAGAERACQHVAELRTPAG